MRLLITVLLLTASESGTRAHRICDETIQTEVFRNSDPGMDPVMGIQIDPDPGQRPSVMILSFCRCQLLPRDVMHKRDLCCHAVSRSCILSKRVNMFSNFFSLSCRHTILQYVSKKPDR